MPSRKRSKGQARKARAVENARHQQAVVALSKLLSSCRHGSPPPTDNLRLRFLESFHKDLTAECVGQQHEHGVMGMAKAVEESHNAFPEVWNNESNRKMAIADLLMYGTSPLQSTDFTGVISLSGGAALCIYVLERYDPEELDWTHSHVLLRRKDVFEGCERSLVKFYRKRIPCGCLDERYTALRCHPQSGTCTNCRQRMPRSELWVCSSCNVVSYCSKECQRSHWPVHRDYCKDVSMNRKVAIEAGQAPTSTNIQDLDHCPPCLESS